MFGHLLHDVAAETGICMGHLVFDGDARTTLAFVKIFENGDRGFSLTTGASFAAAKPMTSVFRRPYS